MKRTVGLFVAAVAVGMLMVSGVALAKTVACEVNEGCVGTNKADTINGTNKSDKINAKGGNDTVKGKGGADDIDAGAGRDTVRGADGNDTINIADGERDLVDCGGGKNDTLIFDQFDRAAPGAPENTANCENFKPDDSVPTTMQEADGFE